LWAAFTVVGIPNIDSKKINQISSYILDSTPEELQCL
jgi:hypothetical protein